MVLSNLKIHRMKRRYQPSNFEIEIKSKDTRLSLPK